MPVTYDMDQRSKEWHEKRMGSIGASTIATLFVKQKEEYRLLGKGGVTYLKTKVEELIFKEFPTLTGEAMDWGNDHEDEARTEYSRISGNEVEEVGFVEPFEGCHASPDGQIGADGLVEIKCPFKADNHTGYVKKGKAPKNYQFQMLHQLYCTRRKWCDFVSFDPRLPKDHPDRLWIKRYTTEELLEILGETKGSYDLKVRQVAWLTQVIKDIAVDMIAKNEEVNSKVGEDNLSWGADEDDDDEVWN